MNGKRNSATDTFLVENTLINRIAETNYKQYYYAVVNVLLFGIIAVISYLSGVNSIATIAVVGSLISFVIIIGMLVKKNE